MWPHGSAAEYGPMNLSLLEILTLLSAATLVVARWLPAVARPRVTIAAGAVFLLAAIALCVTGIRWQLLPVLAGAVVAAPFAFSPLVRSRARRVRWWLALPGSLACAGLIATGPVTAWAFPVPVFPVPSGGFAVGTRVLQWTDPDRAETFTADPLDRRTVVAQLWYPAQNSPADAPRAQYLGRTEDEARTVSEALARGVGLPGFLLDGIPRARTHAIPDAPVAAEGGRFPVVLFSPGSSGVRTQNTAWAEELASHGYVVAALDHPYDSAAVVLSDGRTITSATVSMRRPCRGRTARRRLDRDPGRRPQLRADPAGRARRRPADRTSGHRPGRRDRALHGRRGRAAGSQAGPPVRRCHRPRRLPARPAVARTRTADARAHPGRHARYRSALPASAR